MSDADPCHCGRPVHVFHDLGGYTLNMCEDCSWVRCDLGVSCPTDPEADQ